MSGDLDVPRSTCYPARHLASAAMEEGVRRTQQQSVPPQVPQVGRAAGETGASPSIRRPMLVASVAEAKKPSRGILQWLAESVVFTILVMCGHGFVNSGAWSQGPACSHLGSRYTSSPIRDPSTGH